MACSAGLSPEAEEVSVASASDGAAVATPVPDASVSEGEGGIDYPDTGITGDSAPSVPDSGGCAPRGCSAGACGSQSDGCGGSIQCGACPPNCVPKTCGEVGAVCGQVPNGCGGQLNCGPESLCDDGNECTVDYCSAAGQCAHLAQGSNVLCAFGLGKCQQGACCDGCWNGTQCIRTKTTAACGYGGNACQSCDDGNSCTEDKCSAGGVCSNMGKPVEGQACTSGVCHLGGCVGCGGAAQQCCAGDTCNTDLRCGSTGLCEQCGALNQACCPNSTCDNSSLACAFNNTAFICKTCGGKGQPCCTGNTCGPNLYCLGPVVGCNCGGFNQLPCPLPNKCDPGLSVCNLAGQYYGRCAHQDFSTCY